MLQQAWNARPTCVELFYSGTEVLDKNDLKVLDKECPEYYVFWYLGLTLAVEWV